MARKAHEIEINDNTSDEDLEFVIIAAQRTSNSTIQRNAAKATVLKERRAREFKMAMFDAQESARVKGQKFQEAQITRLIEEAKMSDDQKSVLAKSLSATSAMTLASSSSSSAGFEGTARALDNVSLVINNYIQSAPSAPDISDKLNQELDTRVSELEQQVEAEGIPLTESFRCHSDYKVCMKNSNTPNEEWECKAILAMCLGVQLTTLFSND